MRKIRKSTPDVETPVVPDPEPAESAQRKIIDPQPQPSVMSLLYSHLFSSGQRQALVAGVVVLLVLIGVLMIPVESPPPAPLPIVRSSSVPKVVEPKQTMVATSVSATPEEVRGDPSAVAVSKEPATPSTEQEDASEPEEAEAVDEPVTTTVDSSLVATEAASNALETLAVLATAPPDKGSEDPAPSTPSKSPDAASSPVDASEALKRWAALQLPARCSQPGVLPTGVVAGLELYDSLPGIIIEEKEDAVIADTTSTTEAEGEEAEEGDEATDAEELTAQETAQEEVEAEAGAEAEETGGAAETAVAEELVTGDVTEEAEGGELAAEEAAEEATEEAQAAVESGASEDEGDTVSVVNDLEPPRRKLLKRSTTVTPEPVVEVVPVVKKESVPRPIKVAPAKKGTYQALLKYEPLGSEHKTDRALVSLLTNLSEYESICQFSTRECAQQSAQELAALLRANAQMVQDAEYGNSRELQRVTQSLSQLRNNYRMTMNQTALDSVGASGSMGSCAVIGRGEFTEAGARYGPSTSRFAAVIDMHDTMVYCSSKGKKCIFSSLRAPKVRKVEVDAKAWVNADQVAKQIHELLSEDAQLGAGVIGWGHGGEATSTFINTVVLLRSGLCERVDIYGESERPAAWLKVVGNGHIVSEPGKTWADKKLAIQLQQERYVYQVVSQASGGGVCFFQ